MNRIAFRVLACVGVLAPALASGCAAHRSESAPITISDDSLVRLEEARVLVKRAIAAEKAGHDDEAIALYRESLQHSRSLPVASNNLGLLLMKRKESMEAAAMFLQAADASPSDPRPYYNVGVVYDSEGWSEKALDYYLRSLDRDPQYLDSLRGAGKCVVLLQRADQAALDRVHTALLLEKDTKWRMFFEREQVRIEGRLSAERQMRADLASPPSHPRREAAEQ
jgi:tetratricopeptide (TPR) repeat protein